ncbi:hypothetical protein PCH70_28700 [Pseudomonas cichorii JBC1]|nr:hypothetical protein PCH70_28700 [Pseudomonas cichorii JBC1]
MEIPVIVSSGMWVSGFLSSMDINPSGLMVHLQIVGLKATSIT